MIHNFSFVFSIWASFNNVAISRLSKSWAAISENSRKIYEKLKSFCDTSFNYKNYRNELKESKEKNLTVVPFLARYLSDLTGIDDFYDTKNDRDLINFEKVVLTGTILQELQSWVASPFGFTIEQKTRNFLLSSRVWEENDIYKISRYFFILFLNFLYYHFLFFFFLLLFSFFIFHYLFFFFIFHLLLFFIFSIFPKKNRLRENPSVKSNNGENEEINIEKEKCAIDDSDWDQIFAGGEDVKVEKGHYILKYGSTNTNLYKIKSGIAKVKIPAVKGEKEVGIMESGKNIFFYFNFISI